MHVRLTCLIDISADEFGADIDSSEHIRPAEESDVLRRKVPRVSEMLHACMNLHMGMYVAHSWKDVEAKNETLRELERPSIGHSFSMHAPLQWLS